MVQIPPNQSKGKRRGKKNGERVRGPPATLDVLYICFVPISPPHRPNQPVRPALHEETPRPCSLPPREGASSHGLSSPAKVENGKQTGIAGVLAA